MAVYKEEKTNTWRAVYRYTTGTANASRPRSGASRPSGRHRHGSGNSSIRLAPIWT